MKTKTNNSKNTTTTDIQAKVDFTLLFMVKDGNPNGDPNMANQPRQDSKTRQGLVTGECLKRKIRNQMEFLGKNLFVRSGNVLNDITEELGNEKKTCKFDDIRPELCQQYDDVRFFGGVLSTGIFNGDADGQLRGPVQIGMARSIDPIDIQRITVTRCCVTDKKDLEKERTMGERFITPFGLYRVHGSISVPYCEKTGFSQADLDLFLECLTQMFENDSSSGRPEMSAVKLFVFKHKSKLGNMPWFVLDEMVKVEKKTDVVNPRKVSDYNISLDETVRSTLVGKVDVLELL